MGLPSPIDRRVSRKRRLEEIFTTNDSVCAPRDETSPSLGLGRNAKRLRQQLACSECHRRKQRCNRAEPCSQCITRDIPGACRYDSGDLSEVTARLATLETMFASFIARFESSESRSTADGSLCSTSPPAERPSPLAPATAMGQPSFPQECGSDLETSRALPTDMDQVTQDEDVASVVSHGRSIDLRSESNPILNSVLKVLRDSGLSKAHLEAVISQVPWRQESDRLIDLYFDEIDWTRYKIHKPTFMSRYRLLGTILETSNTNPCLEIQLLKWLPLFFIVLAIASLSFPSDHPYDRRIGRSRSLYAAARSALECADALLEPNLDVLYAKILTSRYMIYVSRPAEGTAPVTTAYQMGLHREAMSLRLHDSREVELRRRAWAMVYHMDRAISLLSGRPSFIHDDQVDTQILANLDDEDLEEDFPPAGRPMDQPTMYTYYIARHKFATIMGKVAVVAFALSSPGYNSVLELDKAMLSWRDSLPSFLNFKDKDSTFDLTHPYLAGQRYLLACEFFHTRITLHRPYFVRGSQSDQKYRYSQSATIKSAMADLLHRRAFAMEKGDSTIASGGYRVLNSIMILGVTIKLDPTSAQAEELRNLLNIVSGRVADPSGRLTRSLVDDELLMVDYLTAIPAAPSPSDYRQLVGLLPALMKTKSGKRAAEEEYRQLHLQEDGWARSDRERDSALIEGINGRPRRSTITPGLALGGRAFNEPSKRSTKHRTADHATDSGLLTTAALALTASTDQLFQEKTPSTLGIDDCCLSQNIPNSHQPALKEATVAQHPSNQTPPNISKAHEVAPPNDFGDLHGLLLDNHGPLFSLDHQMRPFQGYDFSQNTVQYNPFAVEQTGPSYPDLTAENDQSQFLNYLLTELVNRNFSSA